MKSLVYILFFMSLITNMAFVWFVTGHHNHFQYITSAKSFSDLKKDLDNLFELLATRTKADLVWLNIFHEESKDNWLAPFRKDARPLYQSALHYWTREDVPNPIKDRQDEPLLAVEEMDETLQGRCIGRVTGVNNHHGPAGLPVERLIIRCPLMDSRNTVVGTYGITVFNFQYENLSIDIEKYINIVQIHGERIESLLFKK